ncbi:polysaccharide biosynthesis protein [Isobaculum melis]|nr:nucleoside-diphosphate sugar epimerase/dehydratase [Isobaculum melis]
MTKRKILWSLMDAFLIVISCMIANTLLNPFITVTDTSIIVITVLFIVFHFVLSNIFKSYYKMWSYAGIGELLSIVQVETLSIVLTMICMLAFGQVFSIRMIFVSWLLVVAVIMTSRFVLRFRHDYKMNKSLGDPNYHKIRTLIIGAGDGGGMLIKRIKSNPYLEIDPVGIVDDNPGKLHLQLFGVSVLGRIDDIPALVESEEVKQIIIAIPSLSGDEYERILDVCRNTHVIVKVMPSIEDVMTGKLSVNKFRDIDVVDLLGREEIELDMDLISAKLTGRSILVSGAGGSIGSEICRQVAKFNPKAIYLLGHGENSIYLIDKELRTNYANQFNVVPIIADIQDRDRLFSIMEKYKPDVVYHAAAHKHVPMMEYNPGEAIKNNVYGTKNIAEAAKAAGVSSFVMISTDKAVNPPNIMGATKRIAEMIVQSLNEPNKTKFVAVRFGNVLGSRGSVIPLFKEQIQNGGPITLTDKRMTRFFMTIPEASRLVIQAGVLSKGGEIFILDMGEPVKILDLAKKIIKLCGYTEEEIGIIETGKRPGEKLYEELLVDSEKTTEKVYDKIFVGAVHNTEIDTIMHFVESVEGLDEEKLKKAVIQFANDNV